MFRFLLRLFSSTPRQGDFDTPETGGPQKTPSGVPSETRHPPSQQSPRGTDPNTIKGKCFVIDGDTIQITTTRIRLAGIDAPELEDPWGKKAKWAMVSLCNGKVITAELSFEESFDRIVATCFLPDGTDLSAELVRRGLALDWEKFSDGKYRHLEPEGARKKLWRVDAKHRGKYFKK